jgi:hypothetical protein
VGELGLVLGAGLSHVVGLWLAALTLADVELDRLGLGLALGLGTWAVPA